MQPQGFEQFIFWSGVRRATIAPRSFNIITLMILHIHWPRRDSNTQPSDLESDALPLRHRVCHVGKHPGKKAQCFQDGPHQWFKVTSVRGWSCQCLKRLTVCGVYRAGQQTLDFVQASASTHTKIGSIQRRLAWPLRKDDTQIREAFHILTENLTLTPNRAKVGLNRAKRG